MNDIQPLLLNIQTHLEQVNTLIRSNQLLSSAQEHNQTQLLILLQAQTDKLLTQYGKLCDTLTLDRE